MLYDPSKEKRLTPSNQVVDAIIDLVEKGWVGHHPGLNENCLATAAYTVLRNRDTSHTCSVRNTMDHEAQSRGYTRVELWNDAPGRTKSEALAFMEAVRKRVNLKENTNVEPS